MAAPFIKGEISKTLEEELTPQPVETKIVFKKKGNQSAYCAQNSQASGEHDEGQVLNAKIVPELHEWGHSCEEQR